VFEGRRNFLVMLAKIFGDEDLGERGWRLEEVRVEEA
jgi:hypothetical protein